MAAMVLIADIEVGRFGPERGHDDRRGNQDVYTRFRAPWRQQGYWGRGFSDIVWRLYTPCCRGDIVCRDAVQRLGEEAR